MTDAPTMLCAVHTTQQAFATCARCGNYACSYCLGARDICAACVARDEGTVVPWERKDLSLPARFWRTTRDAITQPAHFFGELRSSSTGAAFAYAALVPGSVSFLCVAPLGVCGAMGLAYGSQVDDLGPDVGVYVAAMLALPLVLPILVLCAVAFRASLFHFTAKAAGGGAPFDVSLRACCYTTAFFYVVFAGGLFRIVPVLGTLVSVAVVMAELVYAGVSLTTVAHERYGLTGRRAALAGWLPSAVLALVLAAVVVVMLLPALVGSAPDAYH